MAEHSQGDRPLAPRPDSVSIYEKLREDILSCKLAPGTRIFEQDLGRQFGVSKSPVREALLRLREHNLVEVRPRSGYRVKPISLSEVTEMYEIRFVYEQACVALAIKHGDQEALAKLMEIAAPPTIHSVPEWIDANRRFHAALARACGNSRFAKITSDFIAQFDRFTLVSASRLTMPPKFETFVKEHQAIVTAIQQRNKKTAISLIRRHIEASRKRTLMALNNPVLVP